MGGELHSQFDIYGNLLREELPNGLVTEFAYDSENNLIRQWDNADRAQEMTYDSHGNQTQIRTLIEGEQWKKTAYAYDRSGQMISVEDARGNQVQFTYKNNEGGMASVTTGEGITIRFTYDAAGRCMSVTDGFGKTEYAYNQMDHITREVDPLGNTTKYFYDMLCNITKIVLPNQYDDKIGDGIGIRYLYDAMDEVVQWIDPLGAVYKYDPRNRLTEYTKGGVKTNFIYDNARNLLRDDKAKYTYDAFNRTEKVETFDGHVQMNRYDAEGLRYEMEEDKRLVQFIFRGDEIVGEEKDNKVIRYIRGYDLIASDAESARTYYHYASDEMGSITHLIEGTNVLNHYEYDVWGNTTICEETVENRFRFNGQQYDPITQQYYLRARFYNPVIGRFTQEDTYRGDGLNLYAYCANNPVYYVDPSGYWCEKKEKVFRDLLKERGLTDADLAKDPELKIRMMAEASNIVKLEKKRQPQTSNASGIDFYVTPTGGVMHQAGYNLPVYNLGDHTTGVLIIPDGSEVYFTSNGGEKKYRNYRNSGHVEQQAAIYMKENNIQNAVLYHNHMYGTCNACNSMTGVFLAENSTLTVVPSLDAKAPNKWSYDYPKTYVGTSKSPKIDRRYKENENNK